MDAFWQHGAMSQPGYSYTKDLADVEDFFEDYFNLHQQDLDQPLSTSSECAVTDYPEPNDDPFWWLDDFTNNTRPSYLTGNGSRDLLRDYENSQAQVLTPPAGPAVPEMPCLTQVNHDDLLQIEKPPFSHSTLIAMALQNAPEKKLTSRQIYAYLFKNFPFYRKTKTNWKKVIRSKLNLYDCFKKVARGGCTSGRNNYWIFDQNCGKVLDLKIKRNRRIPSKKLDHSAQELHIPFIRPTASTGDNITSSPALDMSPCFDNFASTVNAVKSDGVTTELTQYLWYLTDYHHNSSLPEESIAQAKLCEALDLPNQSSLVNPS